MNLPQISIVTIFFQLFFDVEYGLIYFQLGNQFLSVYNSSGVTWNQAQSYCNSYGTDLASIHSFIQNSDAYNTILQLNSHVDVNIDEKQYLFAWIGLESSKFQSYSYNYNHNDTYINTSFSTPSTTTSGEPIDIQFSWKWTWKDGTVNNYTKWYKNNNNFSNPTGPQCVHFIGKQFKKPSFSAPVWNAGDCNFVSTQYICNGNYQNFDYYTTTDEVAIGSTVIDYYHKDSSDHNVICKNDRFISIVNYYTPYFSDGSYQNAYTWARANRYCFKHFGTSLASIYTSQENIMIRNLVDDCSLYYTQYGSQSLPFWIGYTDVVKEGKFEWAAAPASAPTTRTSDNDISFWNEGMVACQSFFMTRFYFLFGIV